MNSCCSSLLTRFKATFLVSILVMQAAGPAACFAQDSAAEVVAPAHTARNAVAPGASNVIDLTQSVNSPVGSLTVRAGTTAVIDFGRLTGSSNPAVQIGGNLLNSGIIYALSSNPQVTTATFKATNIFNQTGSTISTVLPASGLPGFNSAVQQLNLSLVALQNIVNEGTISSSGQLSAQAGGNIVNALPAGATGLPPVMQAHNNVNLQAANIVNQGAISSQSANINAVTATLTNKGIIEALTGSISVRNEIANSLRVTNALGQMVARDSIAFSVPGNIMGDEQNIAGKPEVVVSGGSLSAEKVSFSSPDGWVKVHCDRIDGGIEVTGGLADIGVERGLLRLEKMELSGDPVLTNAENDVDVSALFGGPDWYFKNFSTNHEALTIRAGGSVTAKFLPEVVQNGKMSLYTIDVSNPLGEGATIDIAAGVKFDKDTLKVTGASEPGGSINLPQVALLTNGNKISLEAHRGLQSSSGGDVRIGSVTTRGRDIQADAGINNTVLVKSGLNTDGIIRGSLKPASAMAFDPNGMAVGQAGGPVKVTADGAVFIDSVDSSGGLLIVYNSEYGGVLSKSPVFLGPAWGGAAGEFTVLAGQDMSINTFKGDGGEALGRSNVSVGGGKGSDLLLRVDSGSLNIQKLSAMGGDGRNLSHADVGAVAYPQNVLAAYAEAGGDADRLLQSYIRTGGSLENFAKAFGGDGGRIVATLGNKEIVNFNLGSVDVAGGWATSPSYGPSVIVAKGGDGGSIALSGHADGGFTFTGSGGIAKGYFAFGGNGGNVALNFEGDFTLTSNDWVYVYGGRADGTFLAMAGNGGSIFERAKGNIDNNSFAVWGSNGGYAKSTAGLAVGGAGGPIDLESDSGTLSHSYRLSSVGADASGLVSIGGSAGLISMKSFLNLAVYEITSTGGAAQVEGSGYYHYFYAVYPRFDQPTGYGGNGGDVRLTSTTGDIIAYSIETRGGTAYGPDSTHLGIPGNIYITAGQHVSINRMSSVGTSSYGGYNAATPGGSIYVESKTAQLAHVDVSGGWTNGAGGVFYLKTSGLAEVGDVNANGADYRFAPGGLITLETRELLVRGSIEAIGPYGVIRFQNEGSSKVTSDSPYTYIQAPRITFSVGGVFDLYSPDLRGSVSGTASQVTIETPRNLYLAEGNYATSGLFSATAGAYLNVVGTVSGAEGVLLNGSYGVYISLYDYLNWSNPISAETRIEAGKADLHYDVQTTKPFVPEKWGSVIINSSRGSVQIDGSDYSLEDDASYHRAVLTAVGDIVVSAAYGISLDHSVLTANAGIINLASSHIELNGTQIYSIGRVLPSGTELASGASQILQHNGQSFAGGSITFTASLLTQQQLADLFQQRDDSNLPAIDQGVVLDIQPVIVHGGAVNLRAPEPDYATINFRGTTVFADGGIIYANAGSFDDDYMTEIHGVENKLVAIAPPYRVDSPVISSFGNFPAPPIEVYLRPTDRVVSGTLIYTTTIPGINSLPGKVLQSLGISLNPRAPVESSDISFTSGTGPVYLTSPRLPAYNSSDSKYVSHQHSRSIAQYSFIELANLIGAKLGNLTLTFMDVQADSKQGAIVNFSNVRADRKERLAMNKHFRPLMSVGVARGSAGNLYLVFHRVRGDSK